MNQLLKILRQLGILPALSVNGALAAFHRTIKNLDQVILSEGDAAIDAGEEATRQLSLQVGHNAEMWRAQDVANKLREIVA